MLPFFALVFFEETCFSLFFVFFVFDLNFFFVGVAFGSAISIVHTAARGHRDVHSGVCQ